MRRLIWGFTGRTYHIVGNLMSRLIYGLIWWLWLVWSFFSLKMCIWYGYNTQDLNLPIFNLDMSQDMRFPTMWYVPPAKAQISLRLCAVWSEYFLVAWIYYGSQATDWTSFGVSKIKERLYRLVWVYTGQNDTLLEITCCGWILFHYSIYIFLSEAGGQKFPVFACFVTYIEFSMRRPCSRTIILLLYICERANVSSKDTLCPLILTLQVAYKERCYFNI